MKLVQTESKAVADALAEKVEGYMGALRDLFAHVDADAEASRGDGGGTSGGGDGGAEEVAPAAPAFEICVVYFAVKKTCFLSSVSLLLVTYDF